MKRLICVIFIASFILPLTGISQDRVPKGIFFQKLKDLRTRINILTDAPEGKYRNTITACKNILEKAITYEEGYKSDFSVKYVASLDFLINFCGQMNRMELKDREPLAQVLLADLTLKFLSSKSPEAAIEDKVVVDGRLFEVIVTSRKNNQDVNGLRVKWSPLGFFTNYNKPDGSFGELTSPASDEMVPGIYVFWITEDNDNKVINKLEREVNPSKKNLIEFSIK